MKTLLDRAGIDLKIVGKGIINAEEASRRRIQRKKKRKQLKDKL